MDQFHTFSFKKIIPLIPANPGLNDGLAYALKACDFKNFQTMIDKALMLENRRGILSSKRK
jgi:hypothetical protein